MSFGLCTDSAASTADCWAHLDGRVAELSGLPAHPPLLPGEGEPCPAG